MLRWLTLLLVLLPALTRADPPPLHRGVNITGWFRFPVSTEPSRLGSYMSDAALRDLRRAGFDFVRLAVEPERVRTAADRAILLTAIRRIQGEGLAVIVALHPQHWHLETSGADRGALHETWRELSAALRGLPVARTLPEILNEPVFPGDAGAWAALQHSVLKVIRRSLPDSTIVLTGADWGSINGLTALSPEDDANLLYSFHVYEPQELTSLAGWRHDVDRLQLRLLPFPARPPCLAGASGPTADVAGFYCAMGWNQDKLAASAARATAWARRHHVRLLAGEFGATAELNAAARLAWIRAERTVLEDQNIAWALWGYDDVMGFNIARPPGPRPRLDPDLLGALGLPTTM